MAIEQNEYHQAVGSSLPDWSPRPDLPTSSIVGRYCEVELMHIERHAAQLYDAYSQAPDKRDWTYLSVDFPPSFTAYCEYLARMIDKKNERYYAIIDLASKKAVGAATLMRADPRNGVIEVGNIAYSQLLQHTPAGTEAIFLLMKRVFDELKYRRLEWKCDALNRASTRAALRLGFQFEGVFHQAVVYKNRNRDTAWFSILDSEWQHLRPGYEQWLAAENFDSDGMQYKKLSDLIDNSPRASVVRLKL